MIRPASLRLVEDIQNELLLSGASRWEIAIKNSLGRAEFQVDARVLRRGLLDNGYQELTITSEHATSVASLPPIHNAPFDRIMVAQATVEGIVLLTMDAQTAQYPGPVWHVG
jgi:PIN domain nuclease of toxin-antitoxin system